MILVPVLAFIFISSLIKKYDSKLTWKDSFLLGSILWSVVLVVLTEGLSLGHSLSFAGLSAGWLIVTIFLGALVWKNQAYRLSLDLGKLRRLSWKERALLISIVFIALVIAFTAWSFPPNTWDSMTYHLSRVAHWVQNHSLEHYPTHILRQLSYCPFAEYVIFLTLILTGTDYLANFVQFFAMIGSWVGVYAIAGFLGANRLGQLLSMFFAATIPMGILQGSSTQTDYVASFWLVSFVYCVLRWRLNPSWTNAVFAGLGLGLAFLTKAYAYLYAVPFLLLMFFSVVKSEPFKRFAMVVMVLILALLLNTGYFARNISTFGNIYGSTEGTENRQFDVRTLAVNLLCNLGSNLGTSIESLNAAVNKPLVGLIHKIDPSETGHETLIGEISRDEDYAGSFQHVLLGCLTIVLWFFFYRKDKNLNIYMFCLAASAIAFSWGVNWQPWINRFHLPFLVLASPWLGAIWQRLNLRGSFIVIFAILFIFSQAYLFTGNPRKLIGKGNWLKVPRFGRYFVKKIPLAPAYNNAVSGVLYYKCKDIGLLMAADDWEYPLWLLLHKGNKAIRLEHVGVDNVSGKLSYPLGNFNPCMLISTTTSKDPWQGNNGQFKKIWSEDPAAANLSVYLKQ